MAAPTVLAGATLAALCPAPAGRAMAIRAAPAVLALATLAALAGLSPLPPALLGGLIAASLAALCPSPAGLAVAAPAARPS